MSESIFLLLGSNLGDRQANLAHARQEISRLIGQIITTSSLYKTAAWGNTHQPDFYNQVIEVHSSLHPDTLLAEILKIETMMGRERKVRWGPRTMDIDILFWGSRIIKTNSLTIPHAEIQNRRFTLLPLNEIAPDFSHPVLHKTIHELLQACTDNLEVSRI